MVANGWHPGEPEAERDQLPGAMGRLFECDRPRLLHIEQDAALL